MTERLTKKQAIARAHWQADQWLMTLPPLQRAQHLARVFLDLTPNDFADDARSRLVALGEDWINA